MDRHDREQLAERPVIEQRLKHGKIADVLIAERDLELFDFFGHITQAAMHVHDLLGKLPVDSVDFRFGFEIKQAKFKSLLRFILDLLDVVQTLETIPALEPLFYIENIVHELVISL